MKEEIVEDKKKSKSLMKFITKWGTFITIVILFIFFTFANWNSAKNSSVFLTYDNMITIVRSISITAIIAIGLTYSLTVNGMDLSIGANANFADFLVMSMFVWHSMGICTSIALSIVICLVIGLINSFLIVKMKIPDMVAALSTMFMFQGVAMTYSNGGAITERMMMKGGKAALGLAPPAFRGLGKEPWIIVIMLIVVLFAHFFLNYTKYGRYMYAVGGNPEAARLSGIPVNKYRILAYLLSASFAALGGILIAARVGTAQVNAGAAYLMPAVAAAYIGFSVAGAGKPNALGTLAGAVLVGMLENGLIMMSVPYYAMDIIKGAVLAIALALTYATKKET
ncbi:ABC transporter permease [Clostridium sp. OS1-26]|uniref:ABC transporter permease n=1 Tax=Clostridium sp. OS1-26 TaxID=3070681 RepID=UPI0027E022CF|nr:ABC transporter permease [Clostridium sp. OS1-26]WML34825.1 ABC transporter permease [Clostridium sp. OS1-26]